MKLNILNMGLIKTESAVSEILGMMMVLSITVIVIGSVLLVGIPMIESGKEKAKTDVVTNSFLSLQNDIEEVVRGPIWVRDPRDPNITVDSKWLGPSRNTEIRLMEGMLYVLPNNSNITCIPSNCNPVGTNFTIKIPPSNITYVTDTYDTETITYENGAIIRKFGSGIPIMVSYPLINIYDTGDNNIAISIHAVILNGTLSSTGGNGKASIETRSNYYKQIVEPLSFPNSNQTNISIYSKHSDTWKIFFDRKLEEAGLVNGIGYNITDDDGRLDVQITGKHVNMSTPDIFLSVYESKVDVKVK